MGRDWHDLSQGQRFRPARDDQTILRPETGPFDFYAGGGIATGFVDRDEADEPGEDDGLELAIAPLLAAGLAWPVGESEAGVELAVTGNELPNVKLVFRWMF